MWSTFASWAALLALGAALAHYYNPGLLKKILSQPQPGQPALISETPKKVPAKREKTKRTHQNRLGLTEDNPSPVTSSNEGKAIKKRKLVSTAVDSEQKSTTPQIIETQSSRDDDDDAVSNKAFAQQLAKTQAGTKLASTERPGSGSQGPRTVKTTSKSMQNMMEQSGILTDTSSTGREGDDDISPDASPASKPVSTAPTSRAGDISDMLEAPAAKPTVLRLTDISETKSTSKSAPKAFEQVLSKKQRQRQAKQAEQRALQEEADRIHEAKKQAQLRSARMAAGTSNQTKANTFIATQNPWQNGKPEQKEVPNTPTVVNPMPLLDTFESPSTPTAKPNGISNGQSMSDITNRSVNGGSTPKAGAKPTRPSNPTRGTWADQVNEQEQNNWADKLAEEEQWESVTNKKSKKKTRKDTDTSSEASSSFTKPVPTSKPTVNGNHTNGIQAKPTSINRFQSMEAIGGTDLQDAEWEA